MVKVPAAQPAPRVPRSRRDDRYETGHQAGEKRASAGYVVSIQDDYDTVTVDVLDEELTGVIPLGEMPPVGAICEVEARGDLLVIPIWYPGPEQPEWVQDPDFTLTTLPPRATIPTLGYYVTDTVSGHTAQDYAAVVTTVNGVIPNTWDATKVSPEDDFLLDPIGGTPTFPDTDYSNHSWRVSLQSLIGDPFDSLWDYQVDAIHEGYAVETRPPTLPPYTSGPGIEWESDHARMVSATINVTMTYWYDSVPLGSPDATVTGIAALLKVYVYRFAANNNLMIAPKNKRLIHTQLIPRAESAGGDGEAVVTMDVVLNEFELEDWAYGNGVVFYSHLNDPEAPTVTTLNTHDPVIAVSYNARVEINMDASTWTVRPPRWRAVP